jgi:hypothetical protein
MCWTMDTWHKIWTRTFFIKRFCDPTSDPLRPWFGSRPEVGNHWCKYYKRANTYHSVTCAMVLHNELCYFSLCIDEATGCRIRSSLFWDVTQRKLVVINRRFGTPYRSQLQRGWRWDREVVPKLRWIATNLQCVKSQKNEDLVYTAAVEAWDHAGLRMYELGFGSYYGLIFSVQNPARHWGPHSPLWNQYRAPFPRR